MGTDQLVAELESAMQSAQPSPNRTDPIDVAEEEGPTLVISLSFLPSSSPPASLTPNDQGTMTEPRVEDPEDVDDYQCPFYLTHPEMNPWGTAFWETPHPCQRSRKRPRQPTTTFLPVEKQLC